MTALQLKFEYTKYSRYYLSYGTPTYSEWNWRISDHLIKQKTESYKRWDIFLWATDQNWIFYTISTIFYILIVFSQKCIFFAYVKQNRTFESISRLFGV